MPRGKSGGEDLSEVYNAIELVENSIAQHDATSWVPQPFGQHVSRSLQNIQSSYNTEQDPNATEEDETEVYTDIDTTSFGGINRGSQKEKTGQVVGSDNTKTSTMNNEPQPDYGSVRPPKTGEQAGFEDIPPDYGVSHRSEINVEPSPDYGASSKNFTFNMGQSTITGEPQRPPRHKPFGGVAMFPSATDGDQPRTSKTPSFKLKSMTKIRKEVALSGPQKPEDVKDLSKLPVLTVDTILNCIESRYKQDMIYTRCGEILISVNPFKAVNSLYTKEVQGDYVYGSVSDTPHLYEVSSKAFQGVKEYKINQVILVSGESGAGKTEATKIMIEHLMHSSSPVHNDLKEKIIKVNPLLEAFGNAKTALNDNSSRFAKFLSLVYDTGGIVETARIKDYMLEKSRVVHHGQGERSFHAFYALLAGAPEEQLQRLHMRKGQSFRITGDVTTTSARSRKDPDYELIYRNQQEGFRLIGLQDEEIEDIHTILAAVLHLGDIEFEESDHDSVIIRNEEIAFKVASLLQLDLQDLIKVLIGRQGRIGKGEIIQLSKNKEAADAERDSLAKTLYERLFGWLVRKVNESLRSSYNSRGPSIGILDICGFEDLSVNSLEQLCINLVNEQLQNFMNKKVIEEESQLFNDEGIDVNVNTADINNDKTIEMFFNPKTGILAMIDEDSKLQISSDEQMVRKLSKRFSGRNVYLPPISDKPEFTVRHFAGEVPYKARSFIVKNKDNLSDMMMSCLSHSESTLIQDLFTVQESFTGSISMSQFNFRGSRRPTSRFPFWAPTSRLSESINQSRRTEFREKFGNQAPTVQSLDITRRNTHITFFRNSMNTLLKAMKEAQPYFVRCIKPNNHMRVGEFNRTEVRKQLLYNGVCEVARIRTMGFPRRLPIKEFEDRYAEIVANPSAPDLCLNIMNFMAADPKDYKIGKNQVFMKDNVQQGLEEKLAEVKRVKEEEERKRKEEEEKKRIEEEEARRNEAEEKEKRKNVSTTLMKTPGITKVTLSVPHLDPIEEAQSSCGTLYNSTTTSSSQSSGDVPNNGAHGGEGQQENETTEETEGKDTDNEPEENEPWDIFQAIDLEEERIDVHEEPALMAIKCFLYICLFLIMLGSLVVQKVGLLALLVDINPTLDETQEPWTLQEIKDRQTIAYILLIVTICIPYMLGFLISLAKVVFGTFKAPSFSTWLWVLLSEILHTGGLCLLVFRALPRLDAIRSIMLLSSNALLPSALKLIMASPPKGSRCSRAMWTMMDFMVFLIQLSVVPLVVLMDYMPDSASGEKFSDDSWRILELTGAVVLTSFAHWENYVDGRFFCHLKDDNWFKRIILKMRFEMQGGRYKTGIVTTVFKAMLTVLLAFLLRGDISFDFQSAFDKLSTQYENPKSVSAIISCTLAAFVAYVVAYGACKFQMQVFSLFCPLVLATPATWLVYYFDCEESFLSAVTVSRTGCPSNLYDSGQKYWYHILFGVGWWISLLFLNRHLVNPNVDRTADMARLFLNPVYCGIQTAECILMNRRRQKKNVHAYKKYYDMVNDSYVVNYKLQEQDMLDDMQDLWDEEDDKDQTNVKRVVEQEEEAPDEKRSNKGVPMLFACATMWHETRTEMLMLLRSIHRLDEDQQLRSLNPDDPDFYNFEAHIFFDDAMELDDNNERVPNRWVKDLVSCVQEACSSVHQRPIDVHHPYKIPTPYGGQLIWQMPGGNLLFVHLKDMSKIRNRKRWSQVMYMYYLLGYRLVRSCKKDVLQRMQLEDEKRGMKGFDINEINNLLGYDTAVQAQNTFLLALDGDTDFLPGSVKVLLDRMKDEKVGAACGRIHPIGSGPMVWYQKFEYAVGHWLQKSAEHVFGCVLCSPGCFSLFRGSALMDSNVMKRYTTEPTEPAHHLQYDQGEDRWLCTLLLQQGYRIEYAAGADAWTFAPEGFNEFFNQRRRWMPSTLANILDLLNTSERTRRVNANISLPFIMYQWLLMLMTILGPGTVLMMIAGAVKLVFKMSLVEAYLFACIPAIVFVILCFWTNSRIQLTFAAVLSVAYAFIMMIVLVGTIITASEENLFHPSVIVIALLVLIFLISGLCHPKEIACLTHGILYLLVIPSGYLLLVIFSIVNLNDVSWGTREVPTKAQREEAERKKLEKEEKKKNKPQGFFGRLFGKGGEQIKEMTNLIKTLVPERNQQLQQQQLTGLAPGSGADPNLVELLTKIESNTRKLLGKQESGQEVLSGVVVEQPQVKTTTSPTPTAAPTKASTSTGKSASSDVTIIKPVSILKPTPKTPASKRDDLINPLWAEDKALGSGEIVQSNPIEIDFWKSFMTKYLLPIRPSKQEKENIANGLRDLRNSATFGFIITNLMWIALNFMFQLTSPATIEFNYTFGGKDYEFKESVLGLTFVLTLLVLLILQMVAMFIHRIGTLQHLLALTQLQFLWEIVYCRCLSERKKRMTIGATSKEDSLRHIRAVMHLSIANDVGAKTLPPQLADPDDQLGVSVVGVSTRKHMSQRWGWADDAGLPQNFGRSVRFVGTVMDSLKGKGELDPHTAKTVSSLRRRLNGKRPGDVGTSFRPNLPPRRGQQKSFMQGQGWGFTRKELVEHLGEEVNVIDRTQEINSRPEYRYRSTMGRALLQRVQAIDDALTSPQNIEWNDMDLHTNNISPKSFRYNKNRSNRFKHL